MLVEIKPVPNRKTWHGKEGKESFSQPKVIEVLYDPEKGEYATGLTKEEEKEYSKKLGVDLSSKFDPNTPHPYWGTAAARIKLPNRTIFFNTEKPADFVKVKNLKASKFVANSMKEYEEGLYPFATHIIFDEAEEVEIKATKIQKRNKCIEELSKMSTEAKMQIVQILSEKPVGKMGVNYIDVEIDKIIDNEPDEFLKYAKMEKQEVYTRATLNEALHRNILTKESGTIYYMGERLANNFEEAVQWFMHPDNQIQKAAIFEKLNK